MPTKPSVKSLSANSIDILNVIRANASSTYQERIPVATQTNLKEIGQAMLTFQATANEFLSALVNRIGRVLITNKSYTNPYKRFKKGMMEYGETVEEIFVNLAKAHQFDPAVAENEVFKREIPDVDAVFHKMNYQNFYKTTVSNEQLRQAFLSAEGVSDLITRIIESLYNGAEYDEFLIMKQQIVDACTNGKMYPVNVPQLTAANASSVVSTIKGISNQIEFMSSLYNSFGVLTRTPKEKQILIMNAKFDAIIDVEVLASAFNMDKAEFMGQRVLIDDFGALENVVAVLVDEDWFMIFDNFLGFTENYNGEGLYWNYWYHVWKTFSTSPFANAIVFTTDTIGITSVTVTPGTATVTKGQSAQFNASVVTTGLAPKDVTWSVDSDVSTITDGGVLTVATGETKPSLTVTATSTWDSGKSGTATVTVED